MPWKFFDSSGAEKTVAGTPVPIGSIVQFAGATAPTGWLICDGSTASQGTYPALYTVLGATYGSTANGAFTLPDLRGRVPVGLGTAAAVSALGGSDGVTIGNRRPQHKHTVTDPGHTHVVGGLNGGGSGRANVQFADATSFNAPASASGTTGITVGATNDTLDAPAYLVVNHIIRAV